ncbi:hypothetical protein M2152_000208 [Microbacteriaceae bacterium SG_E_30_P1]|uniref:Uncharacterized protein n=1 Tax=Antiquaquibacter oligotrophicus TaxID=2880260 RepID=A0ABT6KK08_9MICO|nr:hypothetical protein [Antiquaquibacter oligotrophicus]MDH6180026.1 hypothetical protein [Antiquaquibacter oligotrophicus]UDF14220.1 hypothetical protein LH407_04995 [Antiquaquibacter oligotrophicus]
MGFFDRTSTVLIQLNARLQPIHRGDLEDALIERVLPTIPKFRVAGGGTGVDKEGRVTGCGIEVVVPKPELEASLVELASALNTLGVPRGSKLITPPKRSIPVGMAEGISVSLPRIVTPERTDARQLHHSEPLDHALDLLGAGLGAEGRVWSWQFLPTGAELAIYGADSERLRELVTSHLPREGDFARYRISEIA